MRKPKEISAQTFLLVMGIALCTVTAVICVFVRWGGTAALVGTYGLLLAVAAGLLAFSLRFMGTDE